MRRPTNPEPSTMSHATAHIPATGNQAWGFFGTMGGLADAAWPVAVAAISAATGCEADEVVAFLDAKDGRHFADQLQGELAGGQNLRAAVATVTACWMAWKIGRRTAREHGIPASMPYLTGWVVHRSMQAELLAG
jgi:hypothetical protein